MFVHTLGSLILVVCLSFLLVKASWQVVLLSFLTAGVGTAIWRIRNAFVRRSKIKGLWKRSMEIDNMLNDLDGLDDLYPQVAVPRVAARVAALPNFLEREQSIRDLTRINRTASSETVQRPHLVLASDATRTEARKFSMSKFASSRTREFEKPIIEMPMPFVAYEPQVVAPEVHVPQFIAPEVHVPQFIAPEVHESPVRASQVDESHLVVPELYPILGKLQQQVQAQQSFGIPLFIPKHDPWLMNAQAQSITH